jgi:exodeoxyribonuclease VII large subunit
VHLNPEATLARGYSIVRDSIGNVVRSSQQLMPGDDIELRFARGSASAEIVKLEQ